MSFIPYVQNPKEMVKSAIERTKKKVSQTTGYDKKSTKKKRELLRVEALAKSLSDKLATIVKETANFDNIHPFYKELISAQVDLNKVRRSLAVINWLSTKILQLDRQYRTKMRRSDDISEITRIRKQFEARVESLLLDNKEAFDTLIEAAAKLEQLPKIKEIPTVILAGYPNVGKSSILRALTGSAVEVKSYPFTTKQLLVGYARKGYNTIQLIDTPGLLDRPLDKMNKIERQALAALNHLSNKVLFVMDPSGTCGYPLKDQLRLYHTLAQRDMDMKLVVNKKDLGEFRLPVTVDMYVSALNDEDMEKLKDLLFEWLYS